ncbi:MAG TPA: sulfotransferase [Gammaproteobacteria bacterium]|nr:sulfotransferase [Gammaproteobacteria bacterium]
MKSTNTSPIFIFSAGWRSGSTMLQRMITATNETLIWGEAGGAINSFSDAYTRYEQMLGEGKKLYKHGYGGNGAKQYEKMCENTKEIAHEWVACLNPPLEIIADSIRDSIESIYKKPALELGYKNWGIKEVQSNIETAFFLKKLFPQAKFIFLVRNPMNCLLSIKRRGWMDKHNDRKAIIYYANHWLNLAKSFQNLDFGILIKYENLIANDDNAVQKLADYLEIPTLSNTFIAKSHVDWQAENNERLTFFERKKALAIIGNEMRKFNYK